MSSFFSNARDFSIDGGTFSIVHGDQHNNYRQRISQASEASTSSSPFANALGPITQATSSSTTTTTIQINGNQYNQVIQREEKVHTEFDDFRNVKRGDICKIRNICQVLKPCEDHWWWEECQCLREVIKTVCTAKLIGVDGEFTTVTYSGRDARKVFEEEFLKLSRIQFAEASQVFAITNGTIPSMVLWHNLIPLVQFVGNVRGLGLLYLETLRRQLGCWDDDLWIDSSRGVICHGPKGPYSWIPGVGLEIKDLPPTAELLQEDVLVRFLASHKSKKADDAFMTAIYDTGNYKDIPEWVNRPTIFSALTKTPIAVANNSWKSVYDNLVERTCLENGWTRFRLDGDGWLSLELDEDIKKAWLGQASSVFHARGVSLDDDLKDFHLVYPQGWLRGDINVSLFKHQLRQQQPIFLFIYPPPPNHLRGRTSSLHHWSFHEDGHSHISPELCFHLGLPVELDYTSYHPYSYSWPATTYKYFHQYQIARGFDPTTADFAKHLGYGHIFQPLDDSNRFEDVQKDQTSPPPNSSADHGGSLNIIDSEYPSDIPDPIRAEDVVSVSDPQNTRDECTKTSYRDVPNKRRRADFEYGGIEAHNHPHQVLRHKNNLDRDGQYMIDTGLRPTRPLPARSLPSPRMNPPHYVQQNTSVAQLHSMHLNPPDNRVSRRYPSLLTSLSSRGGLSPYGSKPSTASMYNSLFLPTRTVEESLYMPHIKDPNSFDTTPPFNPHRIPESAYSISKPISSMTDSPYANPSTYSVGNPAYAADAGYSSGWSGDWQLETPNHRSEPPFVAAGNNNNPFVHRPSIASTSTFFHPSHSTIRTQVPYISHGEVLPPLRYPSGPFDGGRSQHIWSESVIHSQNQPAFSHSWAGSDDTPSYGQREPTSFGYGELEQWGGKSHGEGWF
ncbi:hypothetical protein PQX77_012575 [Marasmius sp. AFHP31]|nr:hypothetical protein PQX77_012575 [Marasmius sp. AFHP31]